MCPAFLSHRGNVALPGVQASHVFSQWGSHLQAQGSRRTRQGHLEWGGLPRARTHSSQVLSGDREDLLGLVPPASPHMTLPTLLTLPRKPLGRGAPWPHQQRACFQEPRLLRAGRAGSVYLLLSLISFVGDERQVPGGGQCIRAHYSIIALGCRQKAQPLLLSAGSIN